MWRRSARDCANCCGRCRRAATAVFSPHAGARRAARTRFTLAEDGESLVAVPSESGSPSHDSVLGNFYAELYAEPAEI